MVVNRLGLTSGTKHIGAQGLEKRIVQKGISWQAPSMGDEVHVHYSVGFEDGVYFDSSRDKGTPFIFKLGQCEVIKGWDEGVSTMKKGERAIFTIPPELAYGEVGSPPLIPPNSTLVFDIEMVSWNTITDITGDGGILKKIIQDGEGWATPGEPDEVLVKYEARLQNGVIVSKSDEGIDFSISNGYLCPAMSIAVKTMRKGEKAELSVKFSYSFRNTQSGNQRIDDDIRPNSNLIIDLELVSWKRVTDVIGDKKVLKKIIKSGEGFDHPNDGSLAKGNVLSICMFEVSIIFIMIRPNSAFEVVYIGKLEDGTVIERKGSTEDPFEYTCSGEQINEGLDMAIMSMRKGEKATVTISSDLCHGSEVSELVSADSVLYYEVTLIDFIKDKPFWKMNTNEKMEASEKNKNDGNILFKAGKYWRASRKYEKALKYIEFDHMFNNDEKCQAQALRVSCNLNGAACKLKLGDYLEASRLCTKVLDLDPYNVKALYRRSQAYIRMSELEKAEVDIKQALAIDPNNRDVKIEYKELKDKQKKHVEYEAKVFSTMLSRMA